MEAMASIFGVTVNLVIYMVFQLMIHLTRDTVHVYFNSLMTLGTSPIEWISWTINIGHNQPTIFKWKYMQEIIFHIYSLDKQWTFNNHSLFK